MTEYSADYLNQHLSSSSRKQSEPAHQSSFLPFSHTHPAELAYQKLVKSIISFETRCDDNSEIGVRLFSSSSSFTMHLRELNYSSPGTLYFHGTNENGEELQLIQNVSQLNVLLLPVKKLGEQPVRIGAALKRAVDSW